MFVACTEKEHIIPSLHSVNPTLRSGAEKASAHCQKEGYLPKLPEWGTPSSRCRGWGAAPQRYTSGTRSTLPGEAALRLYQRSPTRLPEWALCSSPALTCPQHKGGGNRKRLFNRRSRSRVWGLCYTDLSIMILGSPIQGIRCRPCSWYWAFSSSRNSLQA